MMNNKTAKEMFEELGLKLVVDTNAVKIYEYPKKEIIEVWVKFFYNKSYETSVKAIGVNLHKAITKQMEELGWL